MPDQGGGLGRERARADRRRSCARSIPTACTRAIAAALNEDKTASGDDRHAAGAGARADRGAARRDRRAAVVGPRRARQGRGRDRRARAAARLGGHGPDRAALRAIFRRSSRRLMGTPCSLKWREAGERERIWVVNRGHPIAEGLGECIELPNEEMYGEPFPVPEPLETVFISWFEGGEVFRSGLTYQRGAGRIFYFRPGHETYPTYHDADVRQVLRNAVHWAHNPGKAVDDGRRRRRTCRSAKSREPAGREGRRSSASHDAEGLSSGMHRLLLLGTGDIAKHHVNEFAAIPECKIVACVDRIPEPRQSLREGERDRATPSRRSTRRSPGAVRRGDQLHARRRPHGDHAGAARCRQARVLREAAGAEPCRRAGDDRGGGGGRPGQHGEPHLPQRRRPCRRRAHGRGGRDRRRCATSRRATGRAGWSARHWGDWRTEDTLAVAALDQARLDRRARRRRHPHPRFRHLWRRPTTSSACSGALATFPKAEGDRIGDYVLDANDSVAITARLELGRAGDDPRDALRHRPRSTT